MGGGGWGSGHPVTPSGSAHVHTVFHLHSISIFKIIYINYELVHMDQVDMWILEVHIKKEVCMIRKYHNHKLQTNPQYCEEEPQII